MTPIEYLDLEDLIDLACTLLGPRPAVRDIGLLGAAAFRPRTTVFGDDAYPDLWSKAAALLQREKKKYALATQCIGGGQGIATILEVA